MNFVILLFQIREARIIKQSHNPNYLKSNKSKKENQIVDKDSIDDIPIQEITLDIPIQVTCKSNSFNFNTKIYNFSIVKFQLQSVPINTLRSKVKKLARKRRVKRARRNTRQ